MHRQKDWQKDWQWDWRRASLSTRLVTVNGILFAAGTAVLTFSPATVSRRPVLSEVVVLVVGLAVMLAANALLVRAALRPLDRMVAELRSAADSAHGGADVAPLPVPDRPLGRQVALAVNRLLSRIAEGHRQADLAALAAQEAERARIAQELHDGVGQSLTAVLLELGRAEADLEAAREGVRASLAEVRAVTRRLRPHVLEDLGLHSALAELTTDLFARQQVDVRRGIAPGIPPLPDEVELVVFRVAQEALTNIARHAAAGRVDVTLTTRGRRLVLRVADDGIGLPHGADGTGLRGMAERAALVGGTVDVRRADGGGTEVLLEVPLEEESGR